MNFYTLFFIQPATKKIKDFELDKTNHSHSDISFYELVKDIRNLKKLSPQQMQYIKSLPDNKKMELFEIYNECFMRISELI